MGILDVEHRIVARVLDDLCAGEIRHSVVLALHHPEADGDAPALADALTKRPELPRPLRNLDWPAAAQQPHEWDDLDVEVGLTAAHGPHRRSHALDVAAVVGAPDVDQ